MGRTYEMCISDDVRIIRVKLLRNRQDLDVQPDAAVLKIFSGNSVIQKTLSLVDGKWTYHFTDTDVNVTLPGGTGNTPVSYLAKVFATWNGSGHGVFPTKGHISINVFTATT